MKKGNLPNSPQTAKFVAFLFTPNNHLQNDRFIFSIGNFEILLAMKSFGEDDLSASKFPDISAPYKYTCLTVWSKSQVWCGQGVNSPL